MEVSNIIKQIEQFIFEMLMWLVFYPFTLIRVVFAPTSMMQYARDQAEIEGEKAFEGAVRPSLFLLLSIVIGSLVAPIDPAGAEALSQTAGGRFLLASWVNLLSLRMVGYSMLALTGALLYDLLTPGSITRSSLRIPFYQQCYICAPFTLLFSPALVKVNQIPFLGLVLISLTIWLFVSQVLFFKRHIGMHYAKAILLAGIVIVVGFGSMLLLPSVLDIAVRK